jgi:elongation factor 1-beta
MSTCADKLNTYITTRSYIDGYHPTKADATAFAGLSSAPNAATHPHAARWYKHIASFSAEARAAFPGSDAACSNVQGTCKAAAAAAAPAKAAAADDDDLDLFGGPTDEDKALIAKREADKAAAAAAAAAKPKVIAKSSIIFDIKPWGLDTDMEELKGLVRGIQMEGLVWGASELKPVAFGIKKLVQMCTIEDLKVSSDDLEDAIRAFEDHVQSIDIVAFNKV